MSDSGYPNYSLGEVELETKNLSLQQLIGLLIKLSGSPNLLYILKLERLKVGLLFRKTRN
ncbi:MAG: hypothetical protein ACTSUR_06220 [Candidatus Heimdallarchaeaceae archaeon]